MFYHDDFFDVTSGWPNGMSAKYSRDGYVLSGSGGIAINGPVFNDFRASVSVGSNPASAGGGLLFRQNDGGYYVVAAFPGSALHPGSLVVYRVGEMKTEELDHWALIKKASSIVNLEVRCEGKACGIYQEGLLRGQIKNLTSSEGRVGLALVGRGEAVFNDLRAEEVR